ncbi:MAG: O-antigen ligase family protein [Desulfomicrobium sp.]|nr:O-antigen ligase family protein [Pseudomonadota bacterium]MBU4570783.1 O-antigen ligase family protein [Pseudomonadota bacterium]MBV1711381.1 O-antigen ligase family protein [Desulfomicrobium sp.]MBV1720705.1 O-antigen ligase family protein [Desulfomicrobium sp.]
MHKISMSSQVAQQGEGGSIRLRAGSGVRVPLLAAGLLVFVLIGRIQELFPFLVPLRLGLVAMVLNALVLVSTLDLKELGFKMRILPQPKLVLVILCLALFTVPFSVWPGGSWDFIANTYVKSVFAFFVFLHVIKNERDIAFMVWAGVLSVFLLAVLGLLGNAGGRLQVSSTYDANDLAYVMNCFIPLTFYLSRSGGTFLKGCCFVLMGLMIVVVISTASRGGFVAIVSILTFILLKERQHKLKIFLLAAFVGVVAMSFAGPEYWERMGTILDENDYNYQSGVGRIELWKRGVGLMVDNPLIGAGMGQYNVAEGLIHAGERGWKWSVSHNSYLQIGVELGFAGLIVFLLILAKSIVGLRRLQKSTGPFNLSPFLGATAAGLEVGFYGYCVSSVFLSHAYSPVLLYFLALVTALQAVSIRMRPAEESSGTIREIEQSASSTVSGLRRRAGLRADSEVHV